jgi:hypothetical protein
LTVALLLPLVGCRSTNGKFYNPKTWTFYNPFSKKSKDAAFEQQYAEPSGGGIPRPSEMSQPQLDVPQGGYQQQTPPSQFGQGYHPQYNNQSSYQGAAPSGSPIPYSSSPALYPNASDATPSSYAPDAYSQVPPTSFPGQGYPPTSSGAPPAAASGYSPQDSAVAMNPGGSYSAGQENSLYSQPSQSSSPPPAAGNYGNAAPYADSTGDPSNDPLRGSYSQQNSYGPSDSGLPGNDSPPISPETTPPAAGGQYNSFAPGSIGGGY